MSNTYSIKKSLLFPIVFIIVGNDKCELNGHVYIHILYVVYTYIIDFGFLGESIVAKSHPTTQLSYFDWGLG